MSDVDYESIKFIVEKIREEPRYIYELARLYKKEFKPYLSVDMCYDICIRAIKLLLYKRIDEFGDVQVDLLHPEGSIDWHPYRLVFSSEWNSEKQINKKIARILKLQKIGLECSKIYENSSFRAVKRVWKKNVVKSDYNSKEPDIIIDNGKIIIEASSRYENPISYDYVISKLTKAINTYNAKYVVFVAPIFSEGAVEVIREPECFGLRPIKCYFIKYPQKDDRFAGYPLFSKFKNYKYVFDRVYRKVVIVNSREMVNYLENRFKVLKQKMK